MKKKGIAPAFLVGGLIVLILFLVLLIGFVGPGKQAGDSFLNFLFGSEGCSSPVIMADNLQKEIDNNQLSKAAEIYNKFKGCYPNLNPLEVNKDIKESDLDKVIEKAKTI